MEPVGGDKIVHAGSPRWLYRLYAALVLPLLLVVAVSCGSGPEFRIDGMVDGLGTQNLKIVYFSDGAIQQVTASAIDGKFSMIGKTSEPTLVWIYNNAGTLVGRLIVDGGDAVEAEFSITNPLAVKLKGNKESELLARFMTDNAALLAKAGSVSRSNSAAGDAGRSLATDADIDALNQAVERFVKKNRSNVAAAAVLVEFFNLSGGRDVEGRGLLEMIEPDERPENITSSFAFSLASAEFPDSLLAPRNSPLRNGLRLWRLDSDSMAVLDVCKGTRRTLLVFSDDNSRRSDSVSSLTRSLNNRAGVRIIDIAFDADSADWHRSLPDSRDGDIARYWAPAGASSPGIIDVKVERVPYFIVADSTARILYRGASARQALAKITH